MEKNTPEKNSRFSVHEDWVSVLIAFVLLLLAVIGVLGETGIQVKF